MNFDEELARGKLTVGFCPACGVVWPPSDICSRCLGVVTWKAGPRIGTILGFSSVKGRYFCLAEFGSIRIMGSLRVRGPPRAGQKVRLERAGMNGGRYSFEMAGME